MKRACVAAFVAALALPAPAAAHLRTGTVAVDFRTVVTSRPDAAYSVAVYRSDGALRLTVRRGVTVVVLGYLGEPFIRVGPAGVAVNTASPTAAAARLLPKHGGIRGWELRRGRSSVVWHDGRVRRVAPGARRSAWSVPILVDGRRSRISGVTWRVARPALWPWLLGLAAFAAVAGVLARDARRLVRSCIVLGCAASLAGIVTAIGFVAGAYASPGTWIATLDELVFAAVGVGVLAFAPRVAHVPAGIGLGLLGAAIGLSKGAVFLHAEVLSALPATPTRVAGAVAIGAGGAGAALGGLVYARER
jgi:hypothetical protein